MPSSVMMIMFTVVGFVPAFALHLHEEIHEETTTCACKNFKHAYQSGNLSCGDGPEFVWQYANASTQPQAYSMFYDAAGKNLFCSRFLKAFDFDQCINLNIGRDAGQWCYVDSKCNSLNGGKAINSQFSWKVCKNVQGLRDYTLDGLYSFALKLGGRFAKQDFAEIVKLAFVGSRSGELPIMSGMNMGKPVEYPCDYTWIADQISAFHGHWGHPYWFDTREDGGMPVVVFEALKGIAYRVEMKNNTIMYHNITNCHRSVSRLAEPGSGYEPENITHCVSCDED